MLATFRSNGATRLLRRRPLSTDLIRKLHITPIIQAKTLPPRPVIVEEDLEESFLKGSGPGGQKINKTSSAVQIKHIPTGIVVKSQETRSRSQNRKYARQLLAEKLDVLEKGDQSRTAIKAAIKSKKKASASKKTRRKYRALEAEKAAAAAGEGGSAAKTDDAENLSEITDHKTVSDSVGSVHGAP